jgi:DNA-binding MarR family transcriptional regulator
MFVLKDLPSYDTLDQFAINYHNPDVEGLQTWLLWASSTSAMMAAFEANIARFGLSQTQFFVLLLLKRNPFGLSVGALAQGVGVTSQTMTRVLDRMERDQLCSKQADPKDRRAWLIVLTKEGDQLLGQALPAHYAWVAQLMSGFSSEERLALQTTMEKTPERVKALFESYKKTA